jgi:phosphomannomutase/phosphoglucomutase
LSIYKPCDVRGKTTELAPELYRSWGLTLGHQLAPHSKFVVGGDVRRSTPPFLAALSDGLCRAGVDVVDLGLLPTPMIYYAKRRLRAEGCAIVTASHNPASVNGLKWMLGDEPATEVQVRLLEREAESPRPAPNPPDRPRTEPRTLDVTLDYIAWLQDTWLTSREVQRRVVLDPAHGCWAARARRYLQAVFPRCLVAAIHDTPEPEFGGRRPDCSRPELLHGLSDAVYRERADLGIAFDGDGDRVAFVDNEGTPLTAEEATWVLLQSLGPEIAGQRFVYDLKFSDRIAEIAKGLGAEPVVERSGHTFIRTRMLKIGALFGAEVSGHYFFRSLGAGDDGLFTACQLVAHLARCKVSLAELRRMCPPVHMTPDLRVPIAPDRRDAAIAEVRSAWSQYPQVTIDGVRVSFPHGWALVRGSVTEPALTFRFEASSTSRLFDVVHSFCEPLGDLGDQVWEAYETAMVGEDLCPSGQEAADEPG